MAIANTTIQIKKSGTAGVKPTTLAEGELGINYADDKLYYKNSSGNISYFYGANNGPSFSTANANNTLLIASTPNDTLSIVGSGGVSITACTTTKTVTVGYQGALGPQGYQGVQGATGPQGNQGVQGAQGSQGYQGVQGATGPQGNQGVQGAVGAQGSVGAQGNQGIQGATGPQGNQGVQGAVGAQGVQGATGPQGFQGVQGATGPQGLTGVQGVQGAQGSQGYQGVQGATGPQGLTGAQGFQGVQGSTGPQGNQGVQGAAAGVNPSNYITQAKLANNQTIPTGTDTVVAFGSADFDPQGWLNTGNYKITPNVAGYYEITSSVDMPTMNYSGQTNLQLRKNDNSITITQEPSGNGASPVSLVATRTIYLNGSTDYITASVWQGSGGNITLSTGIGIWITVTLISYGINGAQGAQGATGPQGLTGVQGNQGVQGAIGPQGNQGVQGAIGPQGNQGVQGSTGPQGYQGVQGATGPQGNQGVQGSTGPQGLTGAQGNQGVQGATGNYQPAYDQANAAFTQANTAITRLGDSAFNSSEVHIGQGAGSNQRASSGSVAVGSISGGDQGDLSVAIGYSAGQYTQSAGAVAIGFAAGRTTQGNNAIAIGYGAGYGSGGNGQASGTIILNATGGTFTGNTSQPNSFYVNPVRANNTSNGLYYNTTTKEITYGEVRDSWSRIQANSAFDTANTKLSASGFTNNGVLYANSTGYAVNSSLLTFDGTNFGINTYSILASTTFTTSTTTANQIIYSMPTATYRSAKLMVQMTSGTSYQVTELLIIHDGTNAFMTQYGDIATTGSSLGTFDSSITSGNLNLLFTPTNAATTVKLSSSLIVL